MEHERRDDCVDVAYGNIATGWNIAGVGNFNTDGFADMLWRQTSGEAYLFLANGSGGFAGLDLGAVPTNWQIAGVGDFNGDGKADILWRDTAARWLVWYERHRWFHSRRSRPVPPLDDPGAGDFNGDGKADMLWRDTNGDTYLWYSNGSRTDLRARIGNVPTDWQIAGAGDFNGDGKADILWRDVSGDSLIWLMNGTQIVSRPELGVAMFPTPGQSREPATSTATARPTFSGATPTATWPFWPMNSTTLTSAIGLWNHSLTSTETNDVQAKYGAKIFLPEHKTVRVIRAAGLLVQPLAQRGTGGQELLPFAA